MTMSILRGLRSDNNFNCVISQSISERRWISSEQVSRNMTLRVLPPELAKIAKKELNENPKTTKDDVKHLKEWISKQPHLKARTDDQWLVGILRGCKFSLERVKQKLDLYYSLRTTAPDVTLRMKPSSDEFIQFFRLGTCLVLPKPKNKMYPRVILLRAGMYDPNKYHVADIMCILYYLVQILIVDDDVASVLGTKILVDYTGVSMTHFMQATPAVAKKMITVCQEAFPLRLKGSHHFNLSPGIEKIFTIISVFLNKKAKDRLKIHKTPDEIQDSMPKEILPKDYGGDGDSVSELIEHWVSKFKEYRQWMEYEETLGTDESLRPGEPITNQFSGIEGSFRKLDID